MLHSNFMHSTREPQQSEIGSTKRLSQTSETEATSSKQKRQKRSEKWSAISQDSLDLKESRRRQNPKIAEWLDCTEGENGISKSPSLVNTVGSTEENVLKASLLYLKQRQIQSKPATDENWKHFQIEIPETLSRLAVAIDAENRNKFCFQRTVMPLTFCQRWSDRIDGMIDWNSQGPWYLPKEIRLPSISDVEISQPTPDFAMFFTLNSFTGDDIDDPISSELHQCISPDTESHCFPFLFMETDHRDADPQKAVNANLLSASQALFNMYQWVKRTEQEKDFFEDVRVFSIILNPWNLQLRVHRAEKRLDKLIFQFYDLLNLSRYSQDQANLIVRIIVTEYAAEKLHRILFTAFKEVSKQETERVEANRKRP